MKIEEMFAFVSEDETGEGIVGYMMPDGMWMPLVGADVARVDSLRPAAEKIARDTGKPIRLIKFSNRIDLGTV